MTQDLRFKNMLQEKTESVEPGSNRVFYLLLILIERMSNPKPLSNDKAQAMAGHIVPASGQLGIGGRIMIAKMSSRIPNRPSKNVIKS